MKYPIIIFSLVFVFMGCKNDAPSPTTSPYEQHSQINKIDKGTQQMVDSLKAVYARTNFDGHRYENKENVKLMDQYYQTMRQSGKINFQFLPAYAKELLYAGRTEEALEIITLLYQKVTSFQSLSEQSLDFYKLSAIAWLRIGEQQNCIINHSAESCVFPIRGGGIHTLKEGSTNAINLYSQILEKFPNDLESKWLINIAYMTLGMYPDQVPANHLLSPKQIESDYNLPEFQNIAMNLGLDINSLAGGSIVDDFDNDGFLDLVMSSWGMNDQIRFFKSNGNGTFT